MVNIMMDLPLPRLVTAVLCVLGFYFTFLWRTKRLKLTKRQPGCYETPVRYNVTTKGWPRMTGLRLWISAKLYPSRFGRWFLIPQSHKRMNLQVMERLCLEEPPTFQPCIPFEGQAAAADDAVAVEHLIAKKQTTMIETFRFVSISDYYHKYRSGALTPSDVAENIIQAIEDSEKLNPQLRAIIQWDEGEIRRMAAASTERIKNKQPLSVMDGVPVSIKDEFNCTPYILRVGTAYRCSKSTVDATLVAKLRSAGAMIIGIANMQELGTGTTGNNISRYHGTPRNPYNVQHYPGGSSSGSGASVAAGLCPVSIGTDGGGSVRVPASLCGVVGLKATFGRFSAGGCAPLAFTVSHMGPVCSTVRDAAILYGMLAGPDPRDFNTLSQPAITLDGFENADLKGIRMGIYPIYFKHADQEIVETCEKAVKFLQQQGAELEDIEIAEMEEMRMAHIVAIASEFSTGLKADFTEHLGELSPEVAVGLSSACALSASIYVTANKQRTRSINFLKEHVFNKVDVIITPATGVTAPRIEPDHLTHGFSDLKLMAHVMRYVWIGNLTGIPCLTVPVGYDRQGLPICLQIMGRWWEDHVVLRVGNVLESLTENKLKRPQVYYDNLKK